MEYLNTERTYERFMTVLKSHGNENLFKDNLNDSVRFNKCISTESESIFVANEEGTIILYAQDFTEDELNMIVPYIRNLMTSKYVKRIEMNEQAIAIMKQVNKVMDKGHDTYVRNIIMKKCDITKPYGDIKPLDKKTVAESFIKNIADYSGMPMSKSELHYERICDCADIYGIIETDGYAEKLISQCYVPYTNLDEYFVCGVFTEQELRGNGLATALVRAVSNKLLEEKARVVYLDVTADNENAIRAYMSAGFSLCDMYYEYSL